MKRSITLFFVSLLVSSPVWGQTTSVITGTIRDTSGAVVPGAEVTAVHQGTSFVRTAVSGATGRYLFPEMPVGPYEVTAELTGFRPTTDDVVLGVSEDAVLDLVLQIETASTEVIVRGNSVVETESSDLSFLIEQKTIEELPLNGRNYTDLMLLQPGVMAFHHRDTFGSIVAHGLGASVNGRDPRSNVYLLDGTLQNDFTNGPAGSAANTSLGVETIQEFEVATNAYSAEFGRNFGGQVNVISKSGTNNHHGSVYYFHRNDNLDARNFFDRGDTQPEFKRHQFGFSAGGPIEQDRWFYFFGYEGLREGLGRSLTTVVPDLNARQGLLPDPEDPGQLIDVGVDPAVEPYLNAYPLPNGPNLGGGFAVHDFEFDQSVDQNFLQGRIDRNFTDGQFFTRYTFDDAEVRLPTDYPQFPRTFLSRNQFLTAEYRHIFSPETIGTFRGSFARTNIGQAVEANTTEPLPPFIPSRGLVGDIDVGGMPRFGPQVSVDVSLIQNVFGFDGAISHIWGDHAIKTGLLVERYHDNMVNPTFSLGIYRFSSLETFLQNSPSLFIGLGPEGALDRYWRFTLLGAYIQDNWRLSPRLTLNLGLRYEMATVPEETQGRDVSLRNVTDSEPTIGPLFENPTLDNFAPRLGLAWDVFGDGQTALRAGYGLFYNTNTQQDLIVTVTNPPFTPRFIIPRPVFPNPPFERGIGNSIRPIEFDVKTPSVHSWNLNLQQQVLGDVMLMAGYAGSRGLHLMRSGDVNTGIPEILPDGIPFWPADAPRLNPAFSTIELKRSDGDSWYHAMILEARRRFSEGFSFQTSYTWSRSIDTTQASTFFSDASNGTTSAFPEFGTDYNRGLSDFHATHNWVSNLVWEIPFARDLEGAAGILLDGWQLAGIWQIQSGNPLTVFVQSNRSRSQWNPSINPGLGLDRPSLAPSFTHDSAVTGNPDQWFNPEAFLLQPEGFLGDSGRGAFEGPDLQTLDLQLGRNFAWSVGGDEYRVQFKAEFFNVLNRANFSPPNLVAFTGTGSGEVLSTFGRVRSTATSARQIQLGLRLLF